MGKWLPSVDLQDAAIIIGAAAVVAGVALFTPAGALIVGGILLAAFAVLGGPRKG